MASFLEDDLSCAVCFDIYQDPLLLSCGHTFCRQCLEWPDTYAPQACPVCRHEPRREPMSNLALRNTCETYKRERETWKEERGSDGGIQCPRHGERIKFYCTDHREAICLKCKIQNHRGHRVHHLRQAVDQCKDQIKAALRPAEKALESLRNGGALQRKAVRYIQSQTEQTEKQIRNEFEELHQFLREEEEAERAALREEEQEKREKLEEWIEQELHSLSDKVMEVEEEMENDDVTFLKNYDHILRRAQFRPSDSQILSGSLIDVAKHVGNLKYRVWEKMKDLCPYYPVVLNPNSAPYNIAVSGELTCMSRSVRRFYSSNPLLKMERRLVLASEAQNSNFNCWDVEVGDNKVWSIGVCRHSASDATVGFLNPDDGLWGLSRNGDVYHTVGLLTPPFQLNNPPRMVRIKLAKRIDLNNWNLHWVLTFSDAKNGSVITRMTDIPFRRDLFPFLVSNEKDSPLRILPLNVKLTKEVDLSFLERHMDLIPLYVIGFLMVICVLLVVILMCFKGFQELNA